MLQQVIKFVIDTRDRKLIFLKPKLDETRWEVKGYIALDFASDANRRKTISSYLMEEQESQKSVSLPFTEAECMAVLEVATGNSFRNFWSA